MVRGSIPVGEPLLPTGVVGDKVCMFKRNGKSNLRNALTYSKL